MKRGNKQGKRLHEGNLHIMVLISAGFLLLGVLALNVSQSIYAIGVPAPMPVVLTPHANEPQPARRLQVSDLSKTPVLFERNIGQAPKATDFIVHRGAEVVTISASELTLPSIRQQVVKASKATAEATGLVETVTSYFLGNDPKKWHSNVPNYATVSYANIYPKIDLQYRDEEGRLAYEFVVHPGGDAKKIELALLGATSVSVTPSGIVAETAAGTLHWGALHAYQTVDGNNVPVEVMFRAIGNSGYGFALGAYDPTLPLVIDPSLTIDFSTYLGGTGSVDTAIDVAVDSSRNIYIVGTTNSTNFPTSSPYQAANAGSQDGYIVKLNPTGTAILFSTYFGGTGSDQIGGIRRDSSGNIYVSGTTDSTNLPTLSPYQAANAGSRDIFVAKLNATASTLLFSTYFGGTGTENFAASLEIDASNVLYVSATTASSNFPTMNPFQATYGGGTSDSVIAKFSSTGSLMYSTYLGGNGSDGTAALLSVDGAGNMYIEGSTASTNFPTASPYQAANAGATDAYLVKLNPSGSTMVYGTYFGGTGNDSSSGGANQPLLGADGSVVIGGYTESANLPVTANAFQLTHAADGVGGRDLFISKFSSSGSTLQYSTYLGGNAGDNAMRQLRYEADGAIDILGQTVSTNMPVPNGFQTTFGGGGADAYFARLKPGELTLRFGTYLGGTGTDIGNNFQLVPGTGSMVLVGSAATGFPTTAGVVQPTLAGTSDGFVIKVAFPLPQATLHVVKAVTNDAGGGAAASGFTVHVKTGGVDVTGSPAAGAASPGTLYTLDSGSTYVVSENANAGYAATFSGDCDAGGSIALAANDDKTCTITNNDIAPTLTVTKIVTNDDGGTRVVADFPLFIDGVGATSGTPVTLSAGAHTVSETADAGYAETIGGDCAANGTITLAVGDVKNCTITNNDIAPTLTVTKIVVNDSNRGNRVVSDFDLFIDGVSTTSGTPVTLDAGAHTVSETTDPAYNETIGGDCAADGTITLAPGVAKSCTITNNDIALGGHRIPHPEIRLTKLAEPTTLPEGGGEVTYTYQVFNPGTEAVAPVEVVDDTCSPVTFVSSDSNTDNALDPNETWVYACTMMVHAETTNTAVATGHLDGQSYTSSASATVRVENPVGAAPAIHINKSASPLQLPAGGGAVTYDYLVSNRSTVALGGIVVSDDSCAPVSFKSGDADGDAMLDSNESWAYTCATTLQKTTQNTATASGQANGVGVTDVATATVTVGETLPPPQVHIVKTASPDRMSSPGGIVTYRYIITNPGPIALASIVVFDDSCTPLNGPTGDANHNRLLESSETWEYSCLKRLMTTTTNTAAVRGEANALTVTDATSLTVTVAGAGVTNPVPKPRPPLTNPTVVPPGSQQGEIIAPRIPGPTEALVPKIGFWQWLWNLIAAFFRWLGSR